MYAPVVAGGCAYDQPAGKKDTASKPENGCLRQERERLLARAYPVAAPDGYSYAYDPAIGTFTMTGRGDPGRVQLSVPPEVAAQPVARPLPGGRYSISIAAAPLRLHGCG
jgi:hypothetical protein